MSNIRSIEQMNPAGKKVLVRVDFNVPLKEGEVSDDTRIRAALPTIRFLLDAGARVILMSHLGRPAGKGYEEAFSLEPVAKRLSELLGIEVAFAGDICGDKAASAADELQDGEVLLLENLRFDSREKKNDPDFCVQLASMADLYVNDAFGTAHRAHASTAGVAALLPSYAGFLMLREVQTLGSLLDNPDRPFVAILGGSKVSDKIKVINSLIDKCDSLLIGGAMCFTFLMAQGYSVGNSLTEADWVEPAKDLIAKAQSKGVKFLLPVDVVCAEALREDADTVLAAVDAIPDNMMGLDIGPESARLYAAEIAKAATVFWNGPMGVFEMEAFESGTKAVCEAVANAHAANTIIGGGDSVAAVNKFNMAADMSFISTGGGASMELVQGESLPGVVALQC